MSVMIGIRNLVLLSTILTIWYCKPSSDSVLLSDGSTTRATDNLTLQADQRAQIKVSATSTTASSTGGLKSVKSIDLVQINTGTISTLPQKNRYVPLISSSSPLKFALRVTKGTQNCSSSQAGGKLNGTVQVACEDGAKQLEQLKEVCFKLEKENSIIASFPDNDEFCICKRNKDKNLKYSRFIGNADLFEATCRSSAVTHKEVCSEVTKTCPKGKECFAGEQLCQCGDRRLNYSDSRYQNDLVALRLDCMQSINPSTTPTLPGQVPTAPGDQNSIQKKCSDLVSLVKVKNNSKYEATQCTCGRSASGSVAVLKFSSYANQETKFAQDCEAGLNRESLIELQDACQALIDNGSATGLAETTCECTNETLNFDDFYGDVEHFEYSCMGD